MPQITLRAARVNAGFNLKDIADKLGVSEKTVSNWENGKAEPRITHFLKMCEIYSAPVDSIILPKNFS